MKTRHLLMLILCLLILGACKNEGEAETFEGDINGFVFPIYAVIEHNQSNTNYDLIITGQKVKMFKSEKEITLTQQGQGLESVIVFDIII